MFKVIVYGLGRCREHIRNIGNGFENSTLLEEVFAINVRSQFVKDTLVFKLWIVWATVNPKKLFDAQRYLVYPFAVGMSKKELFALSDVLE